MNKKRLLIGILLAAIFLYFFLRNIDFAEAWAYIKSGNPYWLTLAVAANIFNYFMRALRWRLFLLPIKKTKIANLFSTTVIGFGLSSVFPARIGELVRPYLLGMKEDISRSAALATVVVERLFDTLTVLFMLVYYLLFLIPTEQISTHASVSLAELKKTGMIVFAIVTGLVLFLYYLKTKPALIRKLVGKVERFLPAGMAHSIDKILDSFITGLSILHDPILLLRISLWSIVFWMVIAVSFWATVRAYIPDFAFTSTFLIMILLAIGIAVPTPGAVGSYHLACKIGLTRFFDVPDTPAGVVAVVSHIVGFVPVTFLAAFYLWNEGLSTSKLTHIAEEQKANIGYNKFAPGPGEDSGR